MIIIFSGNGKGKTTAAMGTALRALANNKSVEIVQFLKPGDSSEIKLLKSLKKSLPKKFKDLKISAWGKKDWTYPDDLKEEDFVATKKAVDQTWKAIKAKPFLVLIDEILVAVKFNLLNESAVLEMIEECKQKKIHLVLTGRGATNTLTKAADLVTEMEAVKHPFEKGEGAVKGIDY